MQDAANRPDHLLVIDPRVEGWPSRLIAAGPDAAVLILDTHRDGLTQIIEVAENYAPLQGMTLVGYGSPGLLLLGQTVIEAAGASRLSTQLTQLAGLLAGEARLRLLGLPGAGAVGRYLAHILGNKLNHVVVTDHMAARPVLATVQAPPIPGPEQFGYGVKATQSAPESGQPHLIR